MSAVNIVSILSLIEDNARMARITHARAEIMAANMDLNAGKAAEEHRGQMQALLNNTAALHHTLAPKDQNGRITIA